MQTIILLPDSDDDLLKECQIEAFRSSGKGGQHVNKTDSAVRLTHLPTGIRTVCRKERSQYLNKLHCLKNLRLKVARLNERKAPRIATKVPRSVKQENRQRKRKDSQKKKLRSSWRSYDNDESNSDRF